MDMATIVWDNNPIAGMPAQIAGMPVTLVQLPFPSQQDPDPALVAYYNLYERRYREIFPQYQTSAGDLWEAPLWIAHLDGAIGRPDTTALDLSRTAPAPEPIITAIRDRVELPAMLFFSPLAQNLALAAAVSRRLIHAGYRTVLGGNMAELADPADFSVIYTGLARAGLYDEIAGASGRSGQAPTPGRRQAALGYRPVYRLLRGYAGRVPLIRLNASHGCLFACTFCGDAWTKQLHVVPLADLRAELAELRALFPASRLIYIGDKTFGQAPAAVENLIAAMPADAGFELIVQTHVELVSDQLIDQMRRLNVRVVEMGFETADSTVLRGMKKVGGAWRYAAAIERLKQAGLHVILNVLGGLPAETAESHAATLQFIGQVREMVDLYNLYNFVPYPKTPIFPELRARIFDWDFANWREDRPVIFHPYHQTPAQAWTQFLALVAACGDALRGHEGQRSGAA